MFGRSVFDKFSNDPFFDFGSHSNLGKEFPSLTHFEKDEPSSRAVMPRDRERNEIARPSDFFNDGFDGGMFDIMGPMKQMDNMFKSMRVNMDRMMQEASQMHSGPTENGHCYSSSSFYSYDGTKGNEPKIYQAHHSVRSGPGGVKEERKAMRDSTSGEERMHLGQHIGDQGRIYEKRRNIRSNTFDENRDYIGMAESDEPRFTQDWNEKTKSWGNSSGFRHQGRYIDSDRRETSRPYVDFPPEDNERPKHLAIEDGAKSHSRRRDKEKHKYKH